METPNYFAIIPANVRYDKNLKANEKLLYGEITSLTHSTGKCFASNDYFARLYDTSKETVSRWISNLARLGYINVEIVYKENTKQIINRYIQINQEGIDKKINSPIDEKVKDNNTSINNKINKENVPSTRNELSQSEIDATTIAKYLFSTITSVNASFKGDWSKWVKDIELAIRLDKRTKDELINCINWIYNSKKGEFWISNILSGKKLREKYDVIVLQIINDKTSSQSSGNGSKTAKVFVPNNLIGKVFYNRYNQKCEFKSDGIWNHEQDRLIWDIDTVNSYIKSFSDKNILGEINASFKQI